jgi:hypothetical protein
MPPRRAASMKQPTKAVLKSEEKLVKSKTRAEKPPAKGKYSSLLNHCFKRKLMAMTYKVTNLGMLINI